MILERSDMMKKTIIIVLVLYFFQGVIHNLGHPVTPTLVAARGIPDYMFGVFFATMSLGLTIGGPIWGILGDRGNKRIYMSLGLIIYSIGQFGFAYFDNIYLMTFFRFVAGFGVSASVTLLISHVIEHSSKQTRGRNLGWTAAAFTLGSSIGYFMGGLISENANIVSVLGTDNLRYVFYLQAGINIVHAIAMFIFIKDEKKEVQEKKVTIIDGFKDIKNMNPTLIIFLVSLTFINIGTINISKFMDVYFRDLGFSITQLGTFVMVTGLVSLFTSIVIVPFVLYFKHQINLMIIIQVISAIVIAIVFRSKEVLIILYTVFMIYVVIKAIYIVLEQNYIAGYGKSGKFGQIMGVRQAFLAIGMVIGPILGGILYDAKPIYVFNFSVVMFVLGFILLIIVRKRIIQDLNSNVKEN